MGKKLVCAANGAYNYVYICVNQNAER